MAQPKKLEEQQVVDIDHQGNGVIKPDGRVVFIPGVLPGEVINAELLRSRKGHAFGRATEIVTTSSDRVEPFCAHFDDCGGCSWQYLTYPAQLRYKEQIVGTLLARIGSIDRPKPRPIIGADPVRFYRNKLEFSFGAKRWIPQSEVERGEEIGDRRALGLHVKGRFDRVTDISECHLQADPSNRIRNEMRDIAIRRDMSFYDPHEHTGFLRSIMVRTTRDGEVMVVLIVSEERPDLAITLLSELAERVPEISSAFYLVNSTKNDSFADHEAWHVFGTKTITERCGELSLQIHPKSFYQTNSYQAERLYSVVRELADLSGDEELLDLYCGLGSIGLFLADSASRVHGIESLPEAVEQAKENARTNRIENATFQTGDVRDLLESAAGKSKRDNLVMVVDPPRSGLHPDVVSRLVSLAPRRIVYVSCNPATQARDLALLGERYRLEVIQPVDMFPHTLHIETVARLDRSL